MPEKFSQLLPVLGAIAAFLLAAFLLLLIFRLLFGRKIRAPGPRNRPRRLDVVDVFDIDRERQLVIVRRDNIEHLLLIGGPNDLLVEGTINRVEGVLGRPADSRAPAPATNWPAGPAGAEPQPAAPTPGVKPLNLPPDLFAPAPTKPAAPPPPPPPQPAPAPRPGVTAAMPPRPAPAARAPTPPFLARTQKIAQPETEGAAAPGAAPPAPPPRPAAPPPRPAAPAPRPAAPPPAPVASPPKPPAPPAPKPAAPPPAPAAAAPPMPPKAPAPKAPPAPPPAPEPAAKPAEIDPLDSLEEEMARLLGRPDQE